TSSPGASTSGTALLAPTPFPPPGAATAPARTLSLKVTRVCAGIVPSSCRTFGRGGRVQRGRFACLQRARLNLLGAAAWHARPASSRGPRKRSATGSTRAGPRARADLRHATHDLHAGILGGLLAVQGVRLARIDPLLEQPPEVLAAHPEPLQR